MAQRGQRFRRVGHELHRPGAKGLGVEQLAEPRQRLGGDLGHANAAAHARAALHDAPHEFQGSLFAWGDLLDRRPQRGGEFLIGAGYRFDRDRPPADPLRRHVTPAAAPVGLGRELDGVADGLAVEERERAAGPLGPLERRPGLQRGKMVDADGQRGAAARGPDPEPARLRPGGRGGGRGQEGGGRVMLPWPRGVVGGRRRGGGRVPADDDPAPGGRANRLVGHGRRHVGGRGGRDELHGDAVDVEFERRVRRREEQPLRLAQHPGDFMAGGRVVGQVDRAAAEPG